MLSYVCTILAVSTTLVTAIPVEASSPATEDVSTTTRPLPIPRITGYTMSGDSYKVDWNKVENEECPITGYRLKVFQIFEPPRTTLAIDPNENKTLVHDIDIPGVDNTWVYVKIPTGYAKYENRVQAYCADTVFPLSEGGTRIILHANIFPKYKPQTSSSNFQKVVNSLSLLFASVFGTEV